MFESHGPDSTSGGDQRWQLLAVLGAGLDRKKQLGVKNILPRFRRLTSVRVRARSPIELCNSVNPILRRFRRRVWITEI